MHVEEDTSFLVESRRNRCQNHVEYLIYRVVEQSCLVTLVLRLRLNK
jgi:hypothetical protein